MPVQMEAIRGVVLDIEGTTTPIAFVYDQLFNYSRTHVRDYLARHFDNREVQADVQLLRAELAEDASKGKQQPPSLAEPGSPSEIDSLATYANWLIDLNRKSTGLKSLQGKIWHEGYSDGTLRSQVFSDVAPALARWRDAGLSINIFSSGSALAQQLLFAHTEAGDLTPFIKNYFDTSVGKKGEAESYRCIAERIGMKPAELLFVSDIVAELAAAREAGMKTVLSIRPGNQPQESADQYPSIHSFDEL
ncbi:MAG TPA: acireductone synthase [Pyrinomonadaceae bacterium]|nr:acireductone synthase [Pyrinomonadaceae bacterium]